MTSEERAEQFFSVFPIKAQETRKAFITYLDLHAEEQRDICAGAGSDAAIKAGMSVEQANKIFFACIEARENNTIEAFVSAVS